MLMSTCLVLLEVRMGSQILWKWASVWVQGTKLRFSVRAASSLNCWDISPAPRNIFKGTNVPVFISLLYFPMSFCFLILFIRISIKKRWTRNRGMKFKINPLADVSWRKIQNYLLKWSPPWSLKAHLTGGGSYKRTWILEDNLQLWL